MEGFVAANGMVWKGNTLFVTDTILCHTPQAEGEEKKPALDRGVYAFTLDELQRGPIRLSSCAESRVDDHLAVRLQSSNAVGFGADGVTVDDAGYL